MSDIALRKALIRLAHTHPQFRSQILPLVTASGFAPSEIGEEKPGGSADGVSGKADGGGKTLSDADKPWMANEFTQQEFAELLDKQESGMVSDGKADEAPTKVAAFGRDFGPAEARETEKIRPQVALQMIHQRGLAVNVGIVAGVLEELTKFFLGFEMLPGQDDAVMLEVSDTCLDLARRFVRTMAQYRTTGDQTDVRAIAASDADLRKSLIRLASEHPEFRKDLLPLLSEKR